MSNNEAKARIKINKLLEQTGWRLLDDNKGKANVVLEGNIKLTEKILDEYGDDFEKTQNGKADYLLFNSSNKVIAVLEAKSEKKDSLVGKEQARGYAEKLKVPFVILSNGIGHYFWKLKEGCNPESIVKFPTQEDLEYLEKKDKSPPKPLHQEPVDKNYIALTQYPDLLEDCQFLNEDTRDSFIKEKQLKILRDYQLEAVKALQKSAEQGNKKFLFEMATGTGKTLVSSAVIKLFLRTGNAKRVLFLVDRLELQAQAKDSFTKTLKKDFTTEIYNSRKENWRNAQIVISTVQSLLNQYDTQFSQFDFDFVISDEAHRSISGVTSRALFNYFKGYKLGLTATPKDYLKGIEDEDFENLKYFEKRVFLDTYKTFGCGDSREPTFQYNLEKGVEDKHLIRPKSIDARTKITTKLLDEEGYSVIQKDQDGMDEERIFYRTDFEKKFFNKQTNIAFCKHFIEHALKDPISGEIGKSLIFCVSQKHASEIQKIFNQIASAKWPDKYRSDFAVQVTSDVSDAQGLAQKFAYNSLNGKGNFLEDYETSKTRICVTVAMMTTGYDCPDILNLAFMRPIFSPISFIQMKGRGTRLHTFRYEEKTEQKTEFRIFDYFAVCKYFDEDFEYHKKIPVSMPSEKHREDFIDQPLDEHVIIDKTDPIISQHLVEIPDIESRLARATQIISEDLDIAGPFKRGDEKTAIKVLREKHEDKPDLYLDLDEISEEANLDRVITWEEFLHKIFGKISRFQNKDEKLEEMFKRDFMLIENPDTELFLQKKFFKLYTGEIQFREIIDTKYFAELDVTSIGRGFSMNDLIKIEDKWPKIVEYIKKHIDTDQFDTDQ